MTDLTDERLANLTEQLYAWKELAAWADGGWNLPPHVTAAMESICGRAFEALRELQRRRAGAGEPVDFGKESERLADEVIAACGLPRNCHGTIIGALYDAYQFARRYAHPPAAPDAVRPDADDLVMLTYRLIRALEMLKPGNDLGARATEYLRRHNLQGSILRAGDAAKAGGRG